MRLRIASLCSVAAAVALVSGCSRRSSAVAAAEPAPRVAAASPERRVIRATGLIQALESQSIRVPQIVSSRGQMTVTRLIRNGVRVAKGDLLAELDRTSLLDEERDAKAKVDDNSHQLEEKRAQVRSDAAKRTSQLGEAEADLEKAMLQLRKGPILSDIDRMQNEAKAENARPRVASLKKSSELRTKAEAAAVRILELKLERQKVALERIQTNLDRMQIRAPQDGMVALETTWRNGTMGPTQEGDQVWPGRPLIRMFNPDKMVVAATVNEPDAAAFSRAATARLYLDAYPGAVFEAALEYASPVATAGMDSPVRTFTALFRIAQQDPRLLPDLSASLEIELKP